MEANESFSIRILKKIFNILKADDGMMNYFKSGKREGLKHLFNKPPKWNERKNSLISN